MSEGKMVKRSVAIVLGTICIILMAGLGGVMTYYTNTINNKDATLTNYINDHHYTDEQYDKLNSTFLNYVGNHTLIGDEYNAYVSDHHYTDEEYANLLNQVDNLTSILNLSESTVWFNPSPQYVSQPDNSYTNWTFYPPYAGYVVVIVGAASTPLTYIRVTYRLNTGGPVDYRNYDNQVWCGWDSLNGGEGTFPVLPTPIEIRVGNTATGNYTNTVAVQITYYY